MMNRITDILRMIFISIEFLYVLCLITIYEIYPDILTMLGTAISKNQKILEWLIPFLISICVASYILILKLTSPLEKSNRFLYDWSEYWRLQYRRNLSFIYVGLIAIIGVYLWIFADKLHQITKGFLFALVIGVDLIVVSCLLFASITLKEIVEE